MAGIPGSGTKRKTHCVKGHLRSPENLTKTLGCKQCMHDRCRLWSKANPERARVLKRRWDERNREMVNEKGRKSRRQNPSSARNTHLKNRYGITIQDEQRMKEEQGFKCKICRTDFTESVKHEVDHWHDESRAVRGLLCHPCNIGLGAFKDNPDSLISAVYYLEQSIAAKGAATC